MIYIRSFCFNVFFVIWTALCLIGYYPFYLSDKNTARVRALARFWARGVMRGLKLIARITMEVRGAEHIPSGKPVIFASKHQSAFETISLFLFARNPVFVLKKELLDIPLFGKYIREYGMIAVDRSGKGSALKDMLRKSKDVLDGGYSLVIFPEGTRVDIGTEVPFQAGVAALYSNKNINAPVVPVALNSGVYWPRKNWLRYPGSIVVEFLPPIEQGLSRDECLQKLQHDVNSASNRLVKEAQDVLHQQ